MLIDTHCHLNTIVKTQFDVLLPQNFSTLLEPILEEARVHHVTRIINVGTSLIESTNCVLLAKTFKNVWATLGTHPNDLTAGWKDDITAYRNMLKTTDRGRIVGIGEIGLDYHYPDFDKQRQYDGFRAQIELALEFALPIVIHTRDAGDDVLQVIEEYKKDNLKGIIHCFSEDAAFARHAIELGFLLGIGGPLTYPKNEVLRDIFKQTPLDHIVLETDAPFLPPQHMRGKPNTPAQIETVAYFLATLKEVTFEEVAQKTTANAVNLFKIQNA